MDKKEFEFVFKISKELRTIKNEKISLNLKQDKRNKIQFFSFRMKIWSNYTELFANWESFFCQKTLDLFSEYFENISERFWYRAEKADSSDNHCYQTQQWKFTWRALEKENFMNEHMSKSNLGAARVRFSCDEETFCHKKAQILIFELFIDSTEKPWQFHWSWSLLELTVTNRKQWKVLHKNDNRCCVRAYF